MTNNYAKQGFNFSFLCIIFQKSFCNIFKKRRQHLEEPFSYRKFLSHFPYLIINTGCLSPVHIKIFLHIILNKIQIRKFQEYFSDLCDTSGQQVNILKVPNWSASYSKIQSLHTETMNLDGTHAEHLA